MLVFATVAVAQALLSLRGYECFIYPVRPNELEQRADEDIEPRSAQALGFEEKIVTVICIAPGVGS